MRNLWIGCALGLSIGCGRKEPSADQSDTKPAPVESAPPPVKSAEPAARPPEHLSDPLHTSLLGLELTDKLDVGDENAEKAHAYEIEGATWSGTHNFVEPGNKAFVESGRAYKTFDSFRMKVTAGKPHVLIRGYNTFSKDQKLRVSIDGKPAGEWLSPQEPSVYAESAFEIPKELIGDKQEVTIRLDFVSAGVDAHAFYYWLYARTGMLGVKAPLETKVAGMQLVDRVDVGDEADEKQHQYASEGSKHIGTNLYEWPMGGMQYIENGRANKSYESFQVKTRPGSEHLLVKAYDTLSRAQKVRVSVDGSAVGEWSTPKEEKARYGEASFKIPAKFITHDSSTIRLDYVSGSMNDVNTLVAWIYAR